MSERRPVRNRSRPSFSLRGRMMLVAVALGLCSVALVGRAAWVQLVDADFYQRQGEARFVREIPIPTSRGMITDRNGEPVAVSTPVESIWANPQELLRYPDRLPELARVLGVPLDELTTRLSQRADKEFVYLKRRINPDQARAILAHNVPGVFSQREFRRFYPQGEAMAHVLGFTNIDDRGQEGLELAFDEWLRGKPGAKRVIRDRHGRIVESIELVRAAEPGKDLVLSIDRRIQYLAYRELRAALDAHQAAAGSVVVLDVATGEVLAMVNLPSYNPNSPGGVSPDARRNRAVTDLLEPGSTMKPITIAAALEKGVITPTSSFDTNPGWIPNGRFKTSDFRNYGVLDTAGIITKSSNVGSSMVVHKLEDRYFYQFVHNMGYGRSTQSGFPGEAAGLLPEPSRWSGTDKQVMSYGYRMAVTPMQIAHAYATLGNHGVSVPPTFVKGHAGDAREVLSPKVAGEVMRMMQTVTEPGGTGTRAAILGYHVAGKSGTARKASGGSYARRYLAFFAGVVPVENPRFATVVVLDDPDTSKGGSTYGGGWVSAPVFQRVMDGALRLMDVPPDDIETWLAAQAKGDAKRNAAVPALPAALEDVEHIDDAALDAVIPPAMGGGGAAP